MNFDELQKKNFDLVISSIKYYRNVELDYTDNDKRYNKDQKNLLEAVNHYKSALSDPNLNYNI